MSAARCLGLFSLALAVGCGLADYEKRMDEQRERLRSFDDELTLLGDLIEMPYVFEGKEKKPLIPYDIHLRLPRGISGEFKRIEATHLYANQPLFRYFGNKSDFNVFVAAAKIADKNSKDPLKDGEALPEDFRFRVRGGLQDFFQREHKMQVQFPDIANLKKDVRSVRRGGTTRKSEFETIEFDDPRKDNPTHLYVFFQEWVDRQAAVVFQGPKIQNDANFAKVLDISLKSFEISQLATSMRSAPRN